jgi:hypothetical protein
MINLLSFLNHFWERCDMGDKDEDVLIFLAELQSDFQELQIINEKELLRRVFCYFLLSDELILHPAYIWQSTVTNKLVLHKLSDLFSPEIARIALGDSEDILGYMRQRKSQLIVHSESQGTKELSRYEKWSKSGLLAEQARKLDKKFRDRSEFRNLESRDKKFRKLLREDIALEGHHWSIREQIDRFIRIKNVRLDTSEIVEKLDIFVSNSGLVSMETFSNKLIEYGLIELTTEREFRRRMLDLYVRANVDDRVAVPGIARVTHDFSINAFDHNIFWLFFGRIFGEKNADTLSQSDDSYIVLFLKQLRETESWQEFRRIYFEVINITDTILEQNASIFAKKMKKAMGQTEVRVFRRVWFEQRKQLLSVVFGVIATICTVGVLFIIGLISSTYGLSNLLPSVRRFVHEYHQNDLTKLQFEIRKGVEAFLVQK